MKSSHIMAAAMAALSALALHGKDQYFYNVCDIAGATINEDTTQVYFNSRTDSAAFTLSADTTISCKVGVPSGITCFDFTGGDHTLTIDDTLWVLLNNGTEARFKGGTWDFSGKASFYAGYYGSSRYSGQKLLVDGATIRNLSSILFGGRDTEIVLTNGALMATSADNVNLATPGDVSSTSATNVSVVISKGSKLYSKSTIFSDSNSSGGPGLTGNKVLVTGAGSYMGPVPGLTQRLYHGYRTGGNFIRYEKDATAKFYETWIGTSANAKSNVLVIAEGAAYTNTANAGIGTATGADYNRWEIVDGGVLNQTHGNDLSVGKGGCYNEFFVSNGIVSDARSLIAGDAEGSTGNRVRITGRSSRLSFQAEFPALFGCGQGNEWVIEDCDIDAKANPIPGQGAKDWRVYFSGTYSSPNSKASTNNTFRLDEAARLRCYEFQFPVASEGNLAVVANCSTLDVTSVMNVRGHGNVLAVSNATMRLATVTLGSSNATEFVESGNVLAFQGKTPVLTTWSGGGYNLNVYDGGVIRFEIPPDGYDTAAPVPIRTFNTFVYSGTVEFPGLLEFTRNMQEREVTYQLTDAGFRMYDENKEENGTEQLAEITKTLPPGCEVYRDGSLHLMLKVKAASKGLVLIVQ